MIRKIEHLGIAVKNLEASLKIFEALLNTSHYKIERVEREGVATAFLHLGQSKIELLEATTETSAIAKHIAKRNEGIHHIALDVDDIKMEMQRLTNEGFELLHPEPLTGADGKLICFLHPKTTNGVLIELCMDAQ
jgi:methylmalonyl-CoA/ethylmalonyl-CoA epimerase